MGTIGVAMLAGNVMNETGIINQIIKIRNKSNYKEVL
jgi:TRAP-type C4-dicarboxylate transport system permease large subunit